MKKTGVITRIPKPLVEEMLEIKKRERFKTNADAFVKLAEHSKIGREVENMASFWFGKRIRGKRSR